MRLSATRGRVMNAFSKSRHARIKDHLHGFLPGVNSLHLLVNGQQAPKPANIAPKSGDFFLPARRRTPAATGRSGPDR